MSNILFIDNNYKAHYEILESIIVKYKEIIGTIEITHIYLNIIDNKSFAKYISSKYKHVIFKKPAVYNYYIGATLYPEMYNDVKHKNTNKYFYLSHRVDKIYDDAPNIFYLTPLARKNIFIANILPYTEKTYRAKEPVFIVPGDFARRNICLLEKILSRNYERSFKIKIFGKQTYATIKNERVKQCINYDWENYHREFLDCYCVLPLISQSSHPQYYTTTLSSSINYILGYNLKSIIDRDLQNIYDLPNAEVFDKEDDIIASFEKVLMEFSPT